MIHSIFLYSPTARHFLPSLNETPLQQTRADHPTTHHPTTHPFYLLPAFPPANSHDILTTSRESWREGMLTNVLRNVGEVDNRIYIITFYVKRSSSCTRPSPGDSTVPVRDRSCLRATPRCCLGGCPSATAAFAATSSASSTPSPTPASAGCGLGPATFQDAAGGD